jgi:excisionase family DNA binding protein
VIEEIADRVADVLAERGDRDRHDDGWLDVKAAAAHLSCPASRIYALVSAGRIPVHRDGSRLLFRRSELDAYIAAGGARRP